jgi:hypothetical protein
VKTNGRAVTVCAAVVLGLAGLYWTYGSDEPNPIPAVAEPRPLAVEAPPDPARALRGELTGQVVDGEGRPVAAADVDVIYAARPPLPASCAGLAEGCICDDLEATLALYDRAFEALGTATTNAEGRFTISGLPSAALEVRASDETNYARAIVQLSERATVELRLSTPMSGEVAATTEDDEDPVGVALISIVDGKVVDFERSQKERTTQLFAPTASIRGYLPGFAVGRPEPEADITLEEDDGGERDAWSVDLLRGHSLQGKLEVHGGPIADVPIWVKKRGRWGADCATTVTRADGTWSISGLSEGFYDLTARRGSQRTMLLLSTGVASADDAADASIALELFDEVRLHGRVVNERKEPIAAAQITLHWVPPQGTGSHVQLTSDQAGRFEHVGPAGAISLSAKAPGRVVDSAHKNFAPGDAEIELTLGPASVVSGVVVTTNGAVVPNAQIRGSVPHDRSAAVDARRWKPSIATSDAQGQFSLEASPGELELNVTARGFMPTLSSTRSPQTGLRLVMKAGAVLEGRTLTARGAPVAEAVVNAYCGNNTFASDESAEDGLFRIEGLPDADCLVGATLFAEETEGAAKLAASANIVVRNGRTPFLELRMEGTRGLKGRVLDDSGRPVGGVSVFAMRGDVNFYAHGQGGQFEARQWVEASREAMKDAWRTRLKAVITADDGSFTITELMPGKYTLVARKGSLREDCDAPVVVEPGNENVVLSLIRPHLLTALVVGPDGQPVASAEVGGKSWPSGKVALPITFTFNGTMTIGALGFVTAKKTVSLSVHADVELGTIQLERGRFLPVRLTDARSGAPLNGWMTLNGQTLQLGGLDAGVSVPLGSFTARVGALEHLETTVEVSTAQSAIAVALDPGATVTGTVRQPDGNPSHTGVVGLALPNGSMRYEWVRGEGVFAFKGVAAGSTRLYVHARPAHGPEKVVMVPAAGSVTVDLVTPP